MQTQATRVVVSGLEGLTEIEKKQLRMARFDPSKAATLGLNSATTTLEAAHRLKEEEEKRLARAQKFGLNTPEIYKQKRMDRAVKFGLVSDQAQEAKTTRTVTQTLSGYPEQVAKKALKLGMIPPSADEEKKKARAERFGGASLDTGTNDDDKKKSRLERFGMNTINHYNLDTGRVITNSMANKRLREV